MPINRVVFFVVFAALVGVVIYAYFAPDKPPQTAIGLTPKQYIERVEQKKHSSEKNRPAPAVQQAPTAPVP